MGNFTGVRKEGRGYYVAWINGEIEGSVIIIALFAWIIGGVLFLDARHERNTR